MLSNLRYYYDTKQISHIVFVQSQYRQPFNRPTCTLMPFTKYYSKCIPAWMPTSTVCPQCAKKFSFTMVHLVCLFLEILNKRGDCAICVAPSEKNSVPLHYTQDSKHNGTKFQVCGHEKWAWPIISLSSPPSHSLYPPLSGVARNLIKGVLSWA